MIIGIGIDTVDVSRIIQLIEKHGTTFLSQVFTSNEIHQSKKKANPAVYLAERYAAKEAVFKAIAHATVQKEFDWRIIETLNDEMGCPYVVKNETLTLLLQEACIDTIHISLTSQTPYVSAFVIASRN